MIEASSHTVYICGHLKVIYGSTEVSFVVNLIYP
jgi:hypothetical protein